MSFTNSDSRIRFYTKLYVGNMLVLNMPPHFFMQAAAMKEEDTHKMARSSRWKKKSKNQTLSGHHTTNLQYVL
jgi:hypothetical protein